MTPQQIIENNRKIAEFLGAYIKLENGLINVYHYHDKRLVNSCPETWMATPELSIQHVIRSNFNDEYGRFGGFIKNWNKLMPVIEKIGEIKTSDETYPSGERVYVKKVYPRTFGMRNEETGDYMFRFNGFSLFEDKLLINAAYKAVVEFIDWYNSQNLDPDGNPACKVYRGETVLPNEDGKCSLCEGDCTEQ